MTRGGVVGTLEDATTGARSKRSLHRLGVVDALHDDEGVQSFRKFSSVFSSERSSGGPVGGADAPPGRPTRGRDAGEELVESRLVVVVVAAVAAADGSRSPAPRGGGRRRSRCGGGASLLLPRARATGGRSNRERRGWTRGTGSPRGEKVGAVHRHREVESVGGRGGWGRGGARLVPDGLAIVAAASGWMFLALASARGGISPRREPAPSPHGRRARRRSRIVPALLVRRRRRSRDDERGFGAGGVRGFDASMARVRRRARPRRRGWRRERHDLRSAPGGRVTGKVIAELFTRSGECRNGDTSPTFFG